MFDDMITKDQARKIRNAVGDTNEYVGVYSADAKNGNDIDESISYKRTWSGKHKGIVYSIEHHAVSEYNACGIWCYYIHFNEEQFDSETFEEHIWLPTEEYENSGLARYGNNYYNTRVASADWHGGITYYQKKTYHDTRTHKDLRTVVFGCDYNHSWDREYGFNEIYTLSSIVQDAKRTCEELLDLFDIKFRCPWSGKYIDRKYTIEYKGKIVTPAHLGSITKNIYQKGLREMEELET